MSEFAGEQRRSGLSTVLPDVLAASSIVIIDDTHDNVTLLDRILRRAGATNVRGFTDPRQGVADCLRAPPDLVLLDFHMPDLDGLAVMADLRAALPSPTFLPVIILTADITTDAKQRALAAGAKDFLTKPFDVIEVLLRAENLLETRALYHQLEQHNTVLQSELDTLVKAQRDAAAELDRRRQRVEEVLTGPGMTIVFQPFADLSTGQIVGAEALARFDVEPLRPPDVWFAEAAEVGRGADLELAAISSALAQLGRIPPTIFVSVNASAPTASSPRLRELLAESGAKRIVVELTEHDPVDDYDALVDALNELRSMGARVAVDDTGAGYASLDRILRLGAEILKLDITLTRGIDRDPIRRSLAAALVAFANDIGSIIIAEGVETAGELAVLQQLGVPYGQGFHLGRPAPLPLAERAPMVGAS